MPHRLRRSQLIEFEDVAAGHEGMRSDKSGAIVVKPCRQAEIDFYESANQHREFRECIPEFIGTVVLNQEASIAAGVQVPAQTHGHARSQSLMLEPALPVTPAEAWIPSGGGSIAAEKGIALENVAFGFAKPNILDVKLGKRLWADDAPPAKRAKLEGVAAETTSGSLYFRIAGMKTWMGRNASLLYHNSNGYRRFDKFYGRSLKEETAIDGFRQYFLPHGAGVDEEHASRVIRRFIADLRDFAKVLSREESRMYSASLLFVYEGDGEQLREKFQISDLLTAEMRNAQAQAAAATTQEVSEPQAAELEECTATQSAAAVPTPEIHIVEVPEMPSELETAESDSDSEPRRPRIQVLKMIDFAHASWTPGQGPDENVIRGIENTIKVLKTLYDELKDSN